MPPSAEGFVARHLVGPALRTQPDGRLVKLVREGYEAAFEEIVRRYGAGLRRYAAGIVGGRAEDVTQDAFSKALLALRRGDKEIELRPWLFRIVRNTALNDLRDSPPSPRELAETIAGDGSPAEQLERREELVELIQRLQALPEAQRAAIVMRELEGLGHEEIAAALGLSGGAARQAIYRARRTLRDGFGLLLPVSLLKAMLGASASAPVEVAAGAAGVGGAGVALKAATATVMIAGAVGAGVTIDRGHPHDSPTDAGAASSRRAAPAPAFHGGALATADRGEAAGREHRGDEATEEETDRGDERGGQHEGGDHGPSSGTGAGGHDGHGSGSGGDGTGSEPSHHGDDGPGGSSGPGGGGEGSSNSGPGSGEEISPTSTNEGPSSGETSDSSSGPGSGDGSTEQTSGSDVLGDSDGGDGFSVQATQP
jgi:RNA polymerase sigma factor (sigma-70 family)